MVAGPDASAAIAGAVVRYAVLWATFAIGHSLLASRPVRAAVIARVGARERLLFNAVAVAHLAIVIVVGRALFTRIPGFDLTPPARGIFLTVQACGAVGLVLVLRSYDLGRFGGTTQWRTRAPDTLTAPDGPLVTTSLHAHVRHPLYSASILLLIGGATSPFGLATAVLGTAYLAVGLRFEERKLLALYGASYRRYQRQVPALLPLRLTANT